MLNASDVQHYQECGYVVPDFRLPEPTLEQIREQHNRLLADYPQFTDYCPALFLYDESFVEYALNSDLLDMVERLIGDNFAIWNSSFFAKPSKVGSRTPWHQDGEYWPIRPLATCSVWIAVDAATRENGCLQFIPRSHRSRQLSTHHTNNGAGLALPLELDPETYSEDEAVYIELEAGQISIHDIFLMHASDPNNSHLPRRGMTMRFMPTTSVFRRELSTGHAKAIDQKRPIFLLRGKDVSGKNDLRLDFASKQ